MSGIERDDDAQVHGPGPGAPLFDAPRVIAETSFGTITDRQVVFYYNKGWFRGGIREDIPLRHITSVRLEISRHPIWGVFFLIVAFVGLSRPQSSSGHVLGVLLIAFAVLLLSASPKVVINTSGGDMRPATGPPWTRAEAERFVTALRQELFKRP
jgi:hypothetical protein